MNPLLTQDFTYYEIVCEKCVPKPFIQLYPYVVILILAVIHANRIVALHTPPTKFTRRALVIRA